METYFQERCVTAACTVLTCSVSDCSEEKVRAFSIEVGNNGGHIKTYGDNGVRT